MESPSPQLFSQDPPRIPPSPVTIILLTPPGSPPRPAAATPIPAEAALSPATRECCLPPPKKKRYRPPHTSSWPPCLATLRSSRGQSIRVRLLVPEADEQCPLTLSPIAEDDLDFLPGVRFVLPTPQFNKLVLPCGHSFGVMNLVYHFARRDMRCPCCRAGFKDALNPSCVPSHFREPFRARIQQAAIEDRAEQAQADAEVARSIADGAESPSAPALVDILGALPLSMSVYFHSASAPDGPVTSMEFSLAANMGPRSEPEFSLVRPHPNATPHGIVSYFLPAQGQRILNEQLQDPTVTSISLVAHSRSSYPDEHIFELARAGPFPVREEACPYDVTRVLRASNGTYFDVSTQHSPFRLQCIVWRISLHSIGAVRADTFLGSILTREVY